MPTKIFLDTNVLLYTHDATDLSKQNIALDIISQADFVISTQVLTEYAHVCIRKFRFSKTEVSSAIVNLITLEKVVATDPTHFVLADALIIRYDFSFFDALIVATALQSGCKILFTEDLQYKQIIDKKLTIMNPFL
jgi:predicted nucleic acid-binding protein